MVVNAPSEAVPAIGAQAAPFDFESVFRTHYERIARVIARVVGDPARAEELAAELFLKLWRSRRAQGQWTGEWTEACLYKSAVRRALDELRKKARRARYEGLIGFVSRNPTPEEVRAASEDQERVRLVLAAVAPRQGELLALRSQGLSYDELASALNLNPASVGTLLSRAQKAFRKEYIKRYGEE